MNIVQIYVRIVILLSQWSFILVATTVTSQDLVRTTTSLPGTIRAVTEESLQPLIQDNLLQDLKPWLATSRPGGQALSVLDFLDLVHQIDSDWPEYRRNFIAIVAIQHGRISWWAYPAARKWCTSRVQYMQDELDKYSGNNSFTLPDTVFVMNAYDKPLCPKGSCAAPIFSYNKPWVEKHQRGEQGRGGAQPGIPENPGPSDSSSSSRHVESNGGGHDGRAHGQGSVSTIQGAAQRWKRALAASWGSEASTLNSGAQPRGAGRATGAPDQGKEDGREYSGSDPRLVWRPLSTYDDILFPVLNHPFDHLVYYPWQSKNDTALMRAGLYPAMDAHCARVSAHLDVGIYKNRHWKVKLPMAAPVPMEEHARWRFLLSADGQGASWRLAKLLAINSIVLKFQSDSIEYYYRSLKQGLHYISVDDRNFCTSIADLQQQRNQEGLEAMTVAAQSFAYRYLSQASRAAYASAALRHYTGLFSDMQRLLDALDGRQPSLQVLLELRSSWRGISPQPNSLAKAQTPARAASGSALRTKRFRLPESKLVQASNTANAVLNALHARQRARVQVDPS